MTSAIVVGSGPNGLAAALTLASEGVEVTVLEAADTLGGVTRSSELTLPGLVHDECSAAHPLAVDTPFSRRFDLAGHGLTWRWPEVQYAHPLDGGIGAAAYRSVDETAEALGKDGRAWQSVFGALALVIGARAHGYRFETSLALCSSRSRDSVASYERQGHSVPGYRRGDSHRAFVAGPGQRSVALAEDARYADVMVAARAYRLVRGGCCSRSDGVRCGGG